MQWSSLPPMRCGTVAPAVEGDFRAPDSSRDSSRWWTAAFASVRGYWTNNAGRKPGRQCKAASQPASQPAEADVSLPAGGSPGPQMTPPLPLGHQAVACAERCRNQKNVPEFSGRSIPSFRARNGTSVIRVHCGPGKYCTVHGSGCVDLFSARARGAFCLRSLSRPCGVAIWHVSHAPVPEVSNRFHLQC